MHGRVDVTKSEKGNTIRFMQPTVEPSMPLSSEEKLNTLFLASIALLNDGCPFDPKMWICKMGEDDNDHSCTRCWENYLLYIRNGCRHDPYRSERRPDL